MLGKPMNSGPHIDESIPAYLAGELDDEERRAAELHLKDCDSCRSELENQIKLNEVLSQSKPLSPPPDFAKRVLQKVHSEPKRVFIRKQIILPWLAVAAVIAVILFLLRIQKDVAPPPDVVKRAPITKPEIQEPPKPDSKPITKESEPAPQEIVKNEKQPDQTPIPEMKSLQPELTPEEAEMVARLEELENMELISNYENLENLELALIGEGSESLR